MLNSSLHKHQTLRQTANAFTYHLTGSRNAASQGPLSSASCHFRVQPRALSYMKFSNLLGTGRVYTNTSMKTFTSQTTPMYKYTQNGC